MPPTPDERAARETRRVLDALRQRIRLAGLSFRDVERRMGMRHDYLRQVFAGDIELRYEHITGILAALDLPEADFFAEVYGLPKVFTPGSVPPSYPLSALLIAHGTLSMLIWRLHDKGLISAEVVALLIAELQHEREREQRRLAGETV
jgi:transcriptional regulator with XRE-family HTH domain